MTISDEDLEKIIAGVSKSLKSSCLCGQLQNDMPHFFGMLEDVGDGSRRKGIETVREMAKSYSRAHAFSSRIVSGVAVFLTVTVAGWVLWLLGCGIKEWFKGLMK